MVTYVAFLRGINVGGNKLVKMEDLKKAFEALGFTNFKTVLASGNILFETKQKDVPGLTKKIEEKLQSALKKEIGVLVRTIDNIKELLGENPFKKVVVTPQTRLYVTFLSDKPTTIAKSAEGFVILKSTQTEVCTVLTISPDRDSTKLMQILEKTYGKKITTRNRNTLLKIAAK